MYCWPHGGGPLVITMNTSVTFTCTGSVGPYPFNFSAAGADTITITQNGVVTGRCLLCGRSGPATTTTAAEISLRWSAPLVGTLIVARSTCRSPADRHRQHANADEDHRTASISGSRRSLELQALAGGSGTFNALTETTVSTATGAFFDDRGINGHLLSGLGTGILKNTTAWAFRPS